MFVIKNISFRFMVILFYRFLSLYYLWQPMPHVSSGNTIYSLSVIFFHTKQKVLLNIFPFLPVTYFPCYLYFPWTNMLPFSLITFFEPSPTAPKGVRRVRSAGRVFSVFKLCCICLSVLSRCMSVTKFNNPLLLLFILLNHLFLLHLSYCLL